MTSINCTLVEMMMEWGLVSVPVVTEKTYWFLVFRFFLSFKTNVQAKHHYLGRWIFHSKWHIMCETNQEQEEADRSCTGME